MKVLEIKMNGVVHRRIETTDRDACQNCSLVCICEDMEGKFPLCSLDDISELNSAYQFQVKK